ncbi:hypothetical protein EJ08DRAFT_700315 [Tothia fuscella]|uniref:Protein BCP1 n=1 Tax=Tothia fuscella TaxID=1048955 RepID=A0A9P4NL51_9PEZI|nr:hypothetical protein EJ08DRAFT_700315 [Tothia fuscella]
MSKRKNTSDKKPSYSRGGDDESSDEDMDMVDVDFEWFDPQPEVDFHGLKTLCRQLFDIDAQLFDLSALVDLILSQPLLGSTVKVDGNETDPYAFLTVLNLHVHREVSVIKTLTSYLLSKSTTTPSLSALTPLLSPESPSQIGLILTERLINMPAEITPPMYTMLLEEMEWALQEKEPYNFSHYLIFSKTYVEVDSVVDAEGTEPVKKRKKKGSEKGTGGGETFYFHAEDEVLHKFAVAHGSFDYTVEGDEGAADAKRTFLDAGIKPQGHVILIEAAKFGEAVKAVKEYLNPGT